MNYNHNKIKYKIKKMKINYNQNNLNNKYNKMKKIFNNHKLKYNNCNNFLINLKNNNFKFNNLMIVNFNYKI